MLVVVRHGRTEANASGLLQGRLDLGLDAVGREQARRIGERLSGAVRVVSSPLRRARETAEAIAAAAGVEVEIDERWIELDYGDWEGKPISEVPMADWDRWHADPTFEPPGGESLLAVMVRTIAACKDLSAEAHRHDVVAVSHVSPIKCALAWALAAGPDIGWRTHLDTGSISRISFGRFGPQLRGFNDVAHLEGLDAGAYARGADVR